MASIAFLTERMRLGFGVDLVIDQVAEGLAARGHDVTVYACVTDGTYEGRHYRIVPFPVPAHGLTVRFDARAVGMALGSGLPNLLHDVWIAATPPFFALLPLLKGRGIALDCGVSDWSGMRKRVQASCMLTEQVQQRFYFRTAAAITTISEFLRQALPANLRPKTTTILLGADHYAPASAAAGQEMRERLGIADDEVVCLYVGRLDPKLQPYKGTANLLEMGKALKAKQPKARLLLVGFGDDTDVAWIRSQGADAIANAPVEDMSPLFAAADVHLTASRWEGFDLPLVEAQQAGKPVVAFRKGAHAEVVDAGTSGFLADDEAGFVDAAAKLVASKALRDEMGEAARAWAGGFRWADTVEGYDRLVASVLDRLGHVLPPDERRPQPLVAAR